MKKSFKVAVSLATLLATSSVAMGTTVFAAPSIASFIPDGLKTSKNNSSISTVALANVNTASYEDSVVQENVDKFNDEDTVISVAEFVENVSDDSASELTTNTGNTINVDDYDALMPMFDIVSDDGYDMDGSIEVSFEAEVAKEMDKDDLVIMQVSPTSGEVAFIEPSDYDPNTGEITATFEELGPFTILKNVNNESGVANTVSDSDNQDDALAELSPSNLSSGGNAMSVNLADADISQTSSNKNTAVAVPVLASLLAISGVVFFKKRCKD